MLVSSFTGPILSSILLLYSLQSPFFRFSLTLLAFLLILTSFFHSISIGSWSDERSSIAVVVVDHPMRLRMDPSIAHACRGRSTSSAMDLPTWCRLRRSSRAPHSSQRCSAFSSPIWQSLQVGSFVLPTMALHLPRLEWWPVRKRVRSVLSW